MGLAITRNNYMDYIVNRAEENCHKVLEYEAAEPVAVNNIPIVPTQNINDFARTFLRLPLFNKSNKETFIH